ncbi:MAG: hypothetical protein AAF266_02165 [Planctomycetota bacterium]
MLRPLCLLAVAFPSLLAAEAAAQGSLLERLMRDLLESQAQRQQQQAPRQVVVPAAGDARTADLRGRLQAFSTETDVLSAALRDEVRRNRAVAPYLVQMVRVKSRADSLVRRYEKPQPQAVVLTDLKELDQEWRDTAYRLGQVPGLSPPCVDSIARLNDLCRACVRPYEVRPQLDRREVARLADSLAAELHHLERDIDFTLRGGQRERDLLIRLQQAEGLAKLISDAAYQGDASKVVRSTFKRFARDWRPLAAELSAINDRHVRRSLTAVQERYTALRVQLRVKQEIDRGRLATLAVSTQQSVRAACSAVPLSALLDQPAAADLLLAAQEVDRQAAAMQACVAAGESNARLAEHWRGLNTSWNRFESLVTPLSLTEIRRPRQDVSLCLNDLRDVIGITDVFDRRLVTQYAAQLASTANEAQRRVALWRTRPGARIDAAVIREADAVIADCQRLHQRCVGNASPAELARDCRQLAQRWSDLRPRLMECNTADRRVLRRLSDTGTNQLIQLQAALDAAGT